MHIYRNGWPSIIVSLMLSVAGFKKEMKIPIQQQQQRQAIDNETWLVNMSRKNEPVAAVGDERAKYPYPTTPKQHNIYYVYEKLYNMAYIES